MNDQTQADSIAQILLSLPEKPTQRDYLLAFNRCWREAYAQGVVKGSAHTASVMDRVLLSMSAP